LNHRRVIVAVVADMHSGSSLALMDPEIEIKQADTNGHLIPFKPKLTESQEYLWECYTKDLKEVKHLAKKSEIFLIVNGDSTQGNKHPSLLVSNRMSDQIIIARGNLQPWMELPNLSAARIVVGTGAHNFAEGAADILIADQLKAIYKEKNIENLYHGLLDFNGYEIDYAHHGPYPGSRDWLRGNVAGYYLKDIMMRSIRKYQKPPDAVLRAHYHSFVQVPVYVDNFFSQLFVSASYSMLGDYAHQAARSPDTISNGLFCLEVIDGKLRDTHKFLHTLDIRTKESL